MAMSTFERGKLELAAAKVQAYYLANLAAMAGLQVLAPGWNALQELAGKPVSQIVANYLQLGDIIKDWATRRMEWAVNGVRDDGSAYDATRWAAEGNDYLNAAKDQAGILFSPDIVIALGDAAKATYEQVAHPFEQGPGWLQGLIVLGGLGIAAYLLKPFFEVWMAGKRAAPSATAGYGAYRGRRRVSAPRRKRHHA